ncbi:glycosyl hydrolase [Stackebrandtia nassauensis]|nr:glycosyl hydrolase [Stackebrandtia nassauensis]
MAAMIAAAAIGIPVFADTNDSGDRDCQVSEILVNECRPWLGARASDYPQADDSVTEQVAHHEERIGKPLDIVHTFAAEGQLPLRTKEERALANREDTYLYQNWKPAAKWKDAAGGDAEMDEHIDAAADNIAEVAPKKIFLTIHHEPENDVSSDSACDTKEDAAAGTAADYRDMWHNVRERFDAKGIDNVVWVMDYMNYEAWDCLVPKLYPGDEYVDWVMFNAYGDGNKADFAENVGRFYDLLNGLSSEEMDLKSKPWGIVEWGMSDSTQEQARDYYEQAATAVEKNQFPKLSSYMIFDSPGTHEDGGLRVGYDDKGKADAEEQKRYTEFANNPVFEG